ncbi:hypothetical protein Bbelb_151000 [Branchiostoma belcheri]|nr:hypothetical protein Bbelb_151000 [Branchiostoma belcheri]
MIGKFYEHFECTCSVITESSLSKPFYVKSGVRQGCILSPILFLITIDWVMRETTSDRPRGIKWTLNTYLEDLDFADDLAVLSSVRKSLQEKTDRLSDRGKSTGLYINKKKTQVMYINTPANPPIKIDGEALEGVGAFTYLGSVMSATDGAQKDIKTRLDKARGSFSRLQTIWKLKQYSLTTKIRLYNSNVKSVLLYGSESWRMTKTDMRKINSFQNSCLRKICNVFWPNKISNAELYNRTGCRKLTTEITGRRLKWLGHVLRMPDNRIPKVALSWRPEGKRKRGRPKTTWRRTVSDNLAAMGLNWRSVNNIAQDRPRWRKKVMALCLTRDEEDK